MLKTLILVIRFRQQNLSDKDIDIIKFVRRFLKFYRRHFDIVSKYNVGLKTLVLKGFQSLNFMANWCIISGK